FASFRSRLFFNDPATTELYSLSLHDALPICDELRADGREVAVDGVAEIGDLLTVVELDFAGVRALQQIGEERGEFLPLGGRARLPVQSERPPCRLREVERLVRDTADRRAPFDRTGALSKLGSVENADDAVDLRLQLFRRHAGARRRRCCEQDHGEARHHDTSHVGKTRAGARSVRRFYPRANPADWCLEVAGQRVQILVFRPPRLLAGQRFGPVLPPGLFCWGLSTVGGAVAQRAAVHSCCAPT